MATAGNFTIERDKLTRITELFNEQVDPRATEDDVKAEICADWNEGEEHQEWTDSAPVEEIVDWLASFYQV